MQEFEDPFDLQRHSIRSGQRDQDGREIRFVAQPILALNPATNHFLRVQEFQCHPLVAGRYFYTLPAGLWGALPQALGEQQFDSELLSLERAFSELCGDHSMNAPGSSTSACHATPSGPINPFRYPLQPGRRVGGLPSHPDFGAYGVFRVAR